MHAYTEFTGMSLSPHLTRGQSSDQRRGLQAFLDASILELGLDDLHNAVAHGVPHQVGDRMEVQLPHDIGTVRLCGLYA